jgi:large subunit ribosomal protein L18
MKSITVIKTEKRERRHARVRSRVKGTALRPRLAIFRSNKFVYAQLIDDVAGVTLASACDIKDTKGSKLERAALIGNKIAAEAQTKGITSVVFDRGGFKYTGRVRALADAARAAGLAF